MAPASRTPPSKSLPKKTTGKRGKPDTPGKAGANTKVAAKPNTKVAAKPNAKRPAKAGPPVVIPRTTNGYDDDDVMVSGGAARGFGVCGGRVMGTKLEAVLCDRLSARGITHSHSPRHFEIDMASTGKLAAYAPMIVLRGRGRGGKTVVIESGELIDAGLQAKISAFRARYGLEFYVIYVGTEEIIDLVPEDVYDESCSTTDIAALINRLSD